MSRAHARDIRTPDLFDGQLLPEIITPTIGYLRTPRGEWHRYCRGLSGIMAVLPVSWEGGYEA